MGTREWLNEHPRIATGGGIAIVVLAIGLIVADVMASKHRYPSGAPESWFTVDDGKTYFAESSDNVPPFDRSGQVAVHAYVFQCGGQKFVGYLERFTPKYHDLVVAKGLTAEAVRYGREVKRPGDSKWMPTGDLRTEAALTDVKCPNGGSDTPEAIEP